MHADKAELVRGLAELGVALDRPRVDLLLGFLEMLYLWNASAGLTAVRREDAIRLHILDSLVAVSDLVGVGELVDLGTGGGLPGIPLAIVRPEIRVVLVESRRRKCSFLIDAIRSLGLANCSVIEQDARVLGRSGKRFECVVARAFLPAQRLVPVVMPVLSDSGILIALTGPDIDPAPMLVAAKARLRVRRCRDIVLPGGGERRRIIVLERSDFAP